MVKSTQSCSKILTSNTLDLVDDLEINSGLGQGKSLPISSTGIPVSSKVNVATTLLIRWLIKENA
jgi:hypothetical protein